MVKTSCDATLTLFETGTALDLDTTPAERLIHRARAAVEKRDSDATLQAAIVAASDWRTS